MTEPGPQRLERDSFGEIGVPAARLWGAETERARRHFSACEERMPRELLHALALIKAAAARANAALGLLSAHKAEAIARAAEEILAGTHAQEFPLALWQSGSGTQTHMNVNEVLANRASCLLGGECGRARLVDPHDDVNLGQSTNDVMPSAMHIAATLGVRELMPVLERLRGTLAAHAAAHARLVKIGRTHLQDATPLTLGQEISGWCAQVADAAARIDDASGSVRALSLGGTAVGTGLNAHPAFAEIAIRDLARVTGQAFVPSRNRYAAQAAHDDLVALHGTLRTLAVALTKVANDVRWLASGPRCGLGELALPDNEPGSSIMPGKVNPSQCEALVMACCQVCGNDAALGMAGAGGHFELNACKPVIAFNVLFSLRLLTRVVGDFEQHAVRGMAPRTARIEELLQRSLMLVTALTPRIGYARAAAIARHAHEAGLSLREAALESGAVSAAEFDAWVRPAAMVGQDETSDTRGAGD
ncbi:MAG: class II fumarate hydratase [Gammaproteobacteria bacterium]